ncbi:MAG TPA: hypothetical protein VIN07_09950 [Flavipsychrobacter sp.]
MNRHLTLSAVIALSVLVLSSCYKTHDCVCDIKTVTQDTKDTVKSVRTHHTIKGTKADADDACKYYETEEDYLQRYAIIYHYCRIEEDYEK